ncbi:MAG: hypothetical protein KC912_17945 [Proteobacteria bacterium]|nr:hypothetical protein [Pseudomonadota bacterium]
MTRILALTVLLVACNSSPEDDVIDSADDSGAAAVETCDNGVDEDGDSLIDCADDDCAGDASCAWPLAIATDITLAFDANALAKLGGASDCTTRVTSDMDVLYPNDCAECDRIYTGTLAYPSDDCPADPNGPRPTTGKYGVVFTSATTWKIYWVNQGTWTEMGDATDDGSTYTYTANEPVNYEGTEVGSLATTAKYSAL